MRVVVDTNVFVSAMLSGQTPKRVYHAFLNGKITPIFSAETLGELIEVLSRPHFQILRPAGEVSRFIALIERDAIIVTPTRKFQSCDT